MRRRAFLAGAAALTALPARADEAVLARLREPGVHAIMRHALAPGTGDPAGFTLGDCSSQRNLDRRGRAQAVATGAMLREAGARFDRVLTSQWCRCRETANLLNVGPVENEPALNSFFQARERAEAQTAAIMDVIRAAEEETLMLVTHQVNITALLGGGVSSGEVHIFRMDGGAPKRLGTTLIPA